MGDCLLLLYYYIAKKSSNRYKMSTATAFTFSEKSGKIEV